MSEILKEEQPFDYWFCQKCGYRIGFEPMTGYRMDFGCPRCNTSFESFTGRLKRKENEG